ncbi:MAG: right-handed parallel beta-helix repeat-containing protein [Planctomycetota bacterium]|jgi:predicted outer membrane repeat protein
MKSLTLITIGLVLAGSTAATDLEITAETDKPVYTFGEDVTVSVTAYNPTDSPITLAFGSTCQAWYLMDGWYYYSTACGWAATFVTVAPNDSHTWTMVHDSYQRYTCPLRPGKHSVVGIMYGYTEPVEFEIVGELPVIYVATDGNDLTGDGTSQNPFRTIQKGVVTAIPGSDVIVLPGTYTAPGNRDISFSGKGLNLRSQTGPRDCIIDCNGSAAEPHRGFYLNQEEGLSSVVEGFTITNGYADYGGGIYCLWSSPRITNCVFTNNSAAFGGALCSNGCSAPIVVGCTFTANTASDLGGAVYIANEPCRLTWPKMLNCTFTNNSAAADGGAIYNSLSNPTLSSCIFRINSAHRGAAIANNHSSPNVRNCIFAANMAARGGGMYNSSDSHPEIINCTFASNTGGIAGGVLMARGGSAQLANCIFNDNQPRQVWGTATVSYTDIHGGWEGYGNIDADPCFVRPGCWAHANDANVVVQPDDPNAVWVEGDYHLLPHSPCINTGDPNYVPGQNQEDIDGQPRVWDGRVDMGADEFVPRIECLLRFAPRALNLDSRGKWVKAHIVLPEGFTIEDVDASAPLTITPLGIESQNIKIFINDDSLVEIRADFDRAAFCANGTFNGTVIVEGTLTTGQPFHGTAAIKVIDKSWEQIASLASYWLHTNCAAPDWCNGHDLNRDSVVNLIDLAAFDTCCIDFAPK